jgi:hypothetical protein
VVVPDNSAAFGRGWDGTATRTCLHCGRGAWGDQGGSEDTTGQGRNPGARAGFRLTGKRAGGEVAVRSHPREPDAGMGAFTVEQQVRRRRRGCRVCGSSDGFLPLLGSWVCSA